MVLGRDYSAAGLRWPVNRRGARRGARVALALALALCAPSAAGAASLTPKDAQIIAKALGFLDPPAAGGTVAVVYGSGNAASKADADGIASLFEGGLSFGGGTLNAKAVDVASLGDGSGFVAIIVATGGQGDAVMAAAKAHKMLCATADAALVQGGKCIMAVQSDPKVDITVSRDAAKAASIGFASAFSMLIHEI